MTARLSDRSAMTALARSLEKLSRSTHALASAFGTSRKKPPPSSAGASATMASTMVLPCGVSSAAERGSSGVTWPISAVNSPLRKFRASSPATLTTPRSGSSAAFMCPGPIDAHESKARAALSQGRRGLRHRGAWFDTPALSKSAAADFRLHGVSKDQFRSKRSLLPRQFHREFAVADARGEALSVTGGGFLAISRNQLAESGEQTDLRHAVAVDAVEAGLDPCLVQKVECRLLLLVIRHGLARRPFWFHHRL